MAARLKACRPLFTFEHQGPMEVQPYHMWYMIPPCSMHSAVTSRPASASQAADNLPLYGVCCYMEEMVHRPPALLASKYPNSTKPLSRYLVAAPRCYAFLTHFPFFALHMKVGAGKHSAR
jgi:hypothetical protein